MLKLSLFLLIVAGPAFGQGTPPSPPDRSDHALRPNPVAGSQRVPHEGRLRRTRLYLLLENATHNNEHYGNIFTYLRLNGIVPPSSQPAPARP